MSEIEYIGKCLLIEGKEKVLVIGDLHMGYEEVLNRAGVFVSRKMFDEMIVQFDLMFEKIGEVDRIVLLGDIKHEFGSILNQEFNELIKLFDYLLKKGKEIIIIKGNHDKIVEPIALKRKINVKEVYVLGRYCFMHGDKDFKEAWDRKIGYWIVGHAHPAVKLKEGVKVEKYKCFLEGKFKDKKVIVVPSFFDYNEGSDPRDQYVDLAWDFDLNNFKVKIVGENLEVLDFGKLKNV